MKEKRYFYDWLYEPRNAKERVWTCLTLLITLLIGSIIFYNIRMYKHGEEVEAYSETAYQYLDEVATKVIHKNKGIDEAAIPKDVVAYEITKENDEITFEYYLDNNKGKDWATSASMTILLSEDFEVVKKEPNYSSREEYVEKHKGILISMSIISAGVVILIAYFVGSIIFVSSKTHKTKQESNE